MKTLDNRVAKVCPVLSLTWTISKDAGVVITMHDGTNTSQVMASGDHANLSWFETNELLDLSRFDVNHDGIVDLDIWVRITDGASIMGNQEWNSLASGSNLLHFAEFVLETGNKGFNLYKQVLIIISI